MKVSIARVVAFLTPVFAGAAGAGTGWLAVHFPGLPHFNADQVTALIGAGAVSGLTAATSWLKGNREFEKAEQELQHDLARAKAWVKSDPALEEAAKPVLNTVEKIVEKVAETAEAKVVAVLAPAVEAPVEPVVPEPVPEHVEGEPLTDAQEAAVPAPPLVPEGA